MARIAIIRAFRDAAEAGERWFTGDTTPLLAVEDGQTNFEGLAKIKLYPRAAVDWLLSKPRIVPSAHVPREVFAIWRGTYACSGSHCATASYREKS